MSQIGALIDSFIAGYRREFDFYQEASRLCARRCEALLSENGIRGLVTYRAKRPDRLRQKLLKRSQERESSGAHPYRTAEDIRDDIVDFSGVRVALYFPGDRPRFNKLVAEAFSLKVKKDFPQPVLSQPSFDGGHNKRFSGYHATHHRVQLVSTQAEPIDSRYLDIPTEIQVASVLMHAWSEVEHDLIYKPLSGKISRDEYAILDELNGLVLSGEIALELLQRAVEARAGSHGTTLSNQYELAAILFERAKDLPELAASDPVMGRVDLLFKLLACAELNTADRVKAFLKNLHGDTEARPVADQVIDQVLSARPDLYETFISLRDAEPAGLNAPTDPESLHASLLSQFLSRWRLLELFARNYAERGEAESEKGRFSVRDTSKLLGDPALVERFSRLRRMRNAAVHGPEMPTSAALSRGVDEMSAICTTLRNHEDPSVREAFAEAEAG